MQILKNWINPISILAVRPRPAGVRIGDSDDVFDEMENNRVQVAIWTPRWTTSQVRALSRLALTDFNSHVARPPWLSDEDQNETTCTVSALRFGRAPDLWSGAFPATAIYEDVAEKATRLTAAFIRHAKPKKKMTLISSAYDYQTNFAPEETSHADEGKFKGFGNIAGVTTPFIITPPFGWEANEAMLRIPKYADSIAAMPPHSLALWQGDAGGNPLHHMFPVSRHLKFRHTLQVYA